LVCKVSTPKFQNHPINTHVEADRDVIASNCTMLISRSALARRAAVISTTRVFFRRFSSRDNENRESPIIKSFFRSACLPDKRQNVDVIDGTTDNRRVNRRLDDRCSYRRCTKIGTKWLRK